ncbi:hypothetical protein DIE18_03885 [Burkholderia sp. Bp9125]|nr:hypothetical protein DIE18_03885 [Burkholderia sp. Bp9125]
MRELAAHLQKICSCVNMDLADREWARKAGIQGRAGWYFIRTNTPLEVLSRQALWDSTYTRKDGVTARVRNYDIAARAGRYQPDLAAYWNLTDVYSGMHANLLSRAREHTFPDPGTGALALSKYPELASFEWQFFFVTLERFRREASCTEMLLHLGEQMWRAENGWPLLCSE